MAWRHYNGIETCWKTVPHLRTRATFPGQDPFQILGYGLPATSSTLVTRSRAPGMRPRGAFRARCVSRTRVLLGARAGQNLATIACPTKTFLSFPSWISWLAVAVVVCAIAMRTQCPHDGRRVSWIEGISGKVGQLLAEHCNVSWSIVRYIAVDCPSPEIKMRFAFLNEAEKNRINGRNCSAYSALGTDHKGDRNSISKIGKCEILGQHGRCRQEAHIVTSMPCRSRSAIFERGSEFPRADFGFLRRVNDRQVCRPCINVTKARSTLTRDSLVIRLASCWAAV